MTMILKCIQHTLKENLLLLRDSDNLEEQDLQAYD